MILALLALAAVFAPGVGHREQVPDFEHELTETLLGFTDTPRGSAHPNTCSAILSGSPRPGTVWEVDAIAVEVGDLADPTTQPNQGSVLMQDQFTYAVAVLRNGARVGQVNPAEKLIYPGFVSPNINLVRGEVNLPGPMLVHARDQLTGVITSSDTTAGGTGGFSVGPAVVGFRFVFTGRVRKGGQ